MCGLCRRSRDRLTRSSASPFGAVRKREHRAVAHGSPSPRGCHKCGLGSSPVVLCWAQGGTTVAPEIREGPVAAQKDPITKDSITRAPRIVPPRPGTRCIRSAADCEPRLQYWQLDIQRTLRLAHDRPGDDPRSPRSRVQSTPISSWRGRAAASGGGRCRHLSIGAQFVRPVSRHCSICRYVRKVVNSQIPPRRMTISTATAIRFWRLRGPLLPLPSPGLVNGRPRLSG